LQQRPPHVIDPADQGDLGMATRLATWNINSVRLRMPIVESFIEQHRPDILCLQETKCRDAEFPTADFKRLGYPHLAINGQKGYHGVCIASRVPFTTIHKREFCNMGDARHIAASFEPGVLGPDAATVHNFYVPAGGDEPDREINPKFGHKLDFLDEMASWMSAEGLARDHAVVVGDLNIAPLEADVWNHKALLKVVSHTPIEVEKLALVQKSGPWVDVMRRFVPESEKLYTWWSYRSPNWLEANKGRRLDHIWSSEKLAPLVRAIEVVKDARGWERPSDHVPVIADFAH
jgi:exodeoxyribonuclease-3